MQMTNHQLSKTAWTKVFGGGGTLFFGNVDTDLEMYMGEGTAAPASLQGVYLPAPSLSGLNTISNIPTGVSVYLRTRARESAMITVLGE